MAHQRAGKKISSDVKQNIIMFGGLVFCIIFFSIFTSLHGQSIWNPEKLSTLISDVIVTALLSVGAVFVYALGNIDISTGKQVGLYATLMVVIQQQTGKSGRLDFSAGSVMLLSAIIAGNVSQMFGNNLIIFSLLCIFLCVLLNIGVAIVYIYGRLPIIIVTLGMALLYESITAVVFEGRGVNLTANSTLKSLTLFPLVLIPLVMSIFIYAIFTYWSVTGRQAQILANNQQAGVNIGINEQKNILVSYIYSGIILGLATMIYASTGIISASFSSLSSIGGMFTNLLPVFVGLILARFCGDTMGILLGVITMSLMEFAMKAVLKAELGSAVTTMMIGVFLLFINIADAKGAVFIKWVQSKLGK